ESMSFKQHAAVTAVASVCVASLVGISSPGFASAMDRTPVSTTSLTALTGTNGAPSVKFPSTPTPEVPGVTVQKLPGNDSSQTDAVASDDDDAAATSYASLEQAVDAQDVPADADAELSCLAGAIYYESKGEPLSGQLAVADVILNRTHSGEFPSSICGVVTQAGQFSFVRHGEIPHINPNRRAYRVAMAVAQIAMAKDWKSPAPSALYFHAKRVKPGWGLTQVASIGHHVFYR
ncbi:MAG: cell wall hydrolase, partial [Sphingomonas sp.]